MSSHFRRSVDRRDRQTPTGEPQLASPAGPDAPEIDPVMLEEYAARVFGPGIKDDAKKRKDRGPK